MSVNEQLTTSVFPLSTYDKKYAEFVNKVLKESADSFEKEKKFLDNVLLNLYNVFGGIFERALELYEQGRITYIFASESAGVAPYSNRNNARYLVQVKGLSGAIYTFFPDINYCICASFRCQVLNNKSLFTCKHVLAVWLASVTKEKVSYQYITEKQLQNLLLYQTNATCFGTDNGLKVTVEDAKCMQASAYIPIRVFQVFNLKEDGNGHPVTVLIEENGIITDCSLKTQDPDELLDFHLEPENVLNKVVLQTELLKDVLSELDSTSELINLLLSPSPPFFRISTAGLAGLCHIELPHDGELVDNFQCTSKAISSYKLSHIKPAMKALSCANKVSLRTDTCGLLCFQYMVKTEETHICYIEYYISPVIDEDE
ncbi:PREDICTED: cell cycle checkpoint protein RAD1-like [Eufriesea mexicana]|uniref:cell cycle checkpoint protein RAD1-like n=1 Tax=Eufriesea mexicana TaxID=516756 RepID=UPI00083BDF15|nr:PREDICTED: cell cycle checkpoint protein RAD1-like [Eufriesea mexicana]